MSIRDAPSAGRAVGYTLGVDIGGTKLAAAIVAPVGSVFREVWIRHRIAGEESFVSAFVEARDALRIGDGSAMTVPISSVGVSIAAWMDASRTTVRIGANLGLSDLDPIETLRSVFGHVPVALVNDGDATLLGEYEFGVAHGARSPILFTVGTGLGGGVIVDGHLLTGSGGLAGELGHLPASGALACVCGNFGCLSTVLSGVNLGAVAEELRISGSSPELVSMGAPSTARELGVAADRGDIAAIGALDRAASDLARSISTLIPVLDPDVVVLGGSVMEGIGQVLIPLAEQHLATQPFLPTLRPLPRIVKAALGPRAGVLGAAALARRSLDRAGRNGDLPPV